jgi:thymidylate kinase
VCFSGIDGSGKTTLCKNVVAELRSNKVPSRYVYGRFLPVLVSPLFKITSSLVLHKNGLQKQSEPAKQNKKRLLRNPVVLRLYVTGVLLDQLLRVLLKISLPSVFKKDVVICDRYLLDTIVTDVALACDLDDDEVVHLVNTSQRVFPKPSFFFLVDVPPAVAYQRKKDVHSLKALEQLSNTYLKTAKRVGATIIDGTLEPSKLTHIVLTKLETV